MAWVVKLCDLAEREWQVRKGSDCHSLVVTVGDRWKLTPPGSPSS